MSGRIGKVRMKATGFEFRVISGPPEPENDAGAKLMEFSRAISADPELMGCMVIGLTRDGYRIGLHWDDEHSSIPRSLFPSYVAEILRRELLTGPEAESVFDSKFEWVE